MKKLTPDQVELIGVCEKSLEKLRSLQMKAREHHLRILEREFQHMEQTLRGAIELQSRSFRDDTLCDHEPLFPTGFFPYGRRD